MSDYKDPDAWINQSGDVQRLLDKLKDDIVSAILDKKVGPRDAPFWLLVNDLKTTVENVEQKLIRIEQRLNDGAV